MNFSAFVSNMIKSYPDSYLSQDPETLELIIHTGLRVNASSDEIEELDIFNDD